MMRYRYPSCHSLTTQFAHFTVSDIIAVVGGFLCDIRVSFVRFIYHFIYVIYCSPVNPVLSCYINMYIFMFCSSVVRAFAHGAMGHRIDPLWWTH